MAFAAEDELTRFSIYAHKTHQCLRFGLKLFSIDNRYEVYQIIKSFSDSLMSQIFHDVTIVVTSNSKEYDKNVIYLTKIAY